MKSLNIIGCGRLGKTLGFLMAQKNLVTVRQICNTTAQSAADAVDFVGQGQVCCDIAALLAADIYLLATKDAQIGSVCEMIIDLATPNKPSAIFLHCSGALSSDVLIAAKNKGYRVASIHPNKSFADPKLCIQNFSGTLCAMEGDAQALAVLAPLFATIGGICFTIEKNHKTLYHAASVMASNYAVGLFAKTMQCYTEAGIDSQIAQQITHSLMQGALMNLQYHSPEVALTGPLQRGDVTTITQHLAALELSPELLALYKVLGRATLSLAELPATTKATIANLLQ